MAARRGKSQARRNTGNGGGLPGWGWMVIGIVLTIGVILAAPKLMTSDGEDGFFRPRPNPDARPAAIDGGGDTEAVADDDRGDAPAQPSRPQAQDATDYDFYDLLPGQEVAMTDAQIAAAARAEQQRAERDRQRQAQQANGAQPQPLPETGDAPATPPAATAAAATAPAAATTGSATAAAGNDTPYVLQAGAFGGSGDAEAVKAKIALLGLNARVESARIGGKTVYRVRMGPYGTASELAAAKGKLSSGGLPAMAIKAK